MAKNKLDFSYVNADGTTVSGSAAFIHHVYTECGGVDNFVNGIVLEYLKDFVKEHSEMITPIYNKQIKKSRLKAM